MIADYFLKGVILLRDFYSCNSHLVLVIEEIVDQFQIAPTLEVIHSSESCYWYGKRAIYRLQLTEKKEGMRLNEDPTSLRR